GSPAGRATSQSTAWARTRAPMVSGPATRDMRSTVTAAPAPGLEIFPPPYLRLGGRCAAWAHTAANQGRFQMFDRQQTTKVLVIANRTADSDELLAALADRAAQGPARFALVVPATPHGLAWAADMSAGVPEARAQMRAAERRLRSAGLALADVR